MKNEATSGSHSVIWGRLLMLEFLMNTTFLFEILLLLAPEIHLGSLYLPAILQCLQKGYSTSFSKMCIVLFFFPPESSFRRWCPLLFAGTEKLIFPIFYFLVCLLCVLVVFCLFWLLFCFVCFFVFGWLGFFHSNYSVFLDLCSFLILETGQFWQLQKLIRQEKSARQDSNILVN